MVLLVPGGVNFVFGLWAMLYLSYLFRVIYDCKCKNEIHYEYSKISCISTRLLRRMGYVLAALQVAALGAARDHPASLPLVPIFYMYLVRPQKLSHKKISPSTQARPISLGLQLTKERWRQRGVRAAPDKCEQGFSWDDQKSHGRRLDKSTVCRLCHFLPPG